MANKKEKAIDFALAVKDEAVEYGIQDSKLILIFTELLNSITDDGASEFIGYLMGSIAPSLNGIRLNYKQNRFERNMTSAINSLSDRMDVLENNFKRLVGEPREKFCGLYLEWLLDNIEQEKQDEKVKYHINGFLGLMNNEANDNLMLMFFDTMNELTQLDIDALKMYDIDNGENIYTVCEKYNLEFEQLRVIKAKLHRLGLLSSKNEEKIDDNIEQVVAYLQKLGTDNKRKSPKGVRLPKFKRISSTDNYSITSLGRHYLKIIS